MAKSTVASYKKNTVWPACAKYVKLRESDCNGIVKCVTCKKFMSIYDQECNAGHFIPGRGNVVLFDDAHIFPQCSDCNCDGGGEQYKFGEFLKDKYGYTEAQLDDIRHMRHQSKKFSMIDLKYIKKRYDEASDKLRKEKGIL